MIKKTEKNEIKSLAHSKYRCLYHIVFAPKYRRKEIYGQLKKTWMKYFESYVNKREWKARPHNHSVQKLGWANFHLFD